MSDNIILTGSLDHSAILWQIGDSETEIETVKDSKDFEHKIELWHDAPISSVAISSCKQQVVTASMDGVAKIWNLQGTFLWSLEGHNGGVSSVASAGKYIITGSMDGTALLWRVEGAIVYKKNR